MEVRGNGERSVRASVCIHVHHAEHHPHRSSKYINRVGRGAASHSCQFPLNIEYRYQFLGTQNFGLRPNFGVGSRMASDEKGPKIGRGSISPLRSAKEEAPLFPDIGRYLDVFWLVCRHISDLG